MASDQGHRDVNIQQHSAFQAVHVVMPLDTPVVSTRLVRERQLLNETVCRQQVQGSIDRAIGDPGIATAHALEDLASGQVRI
jgi:hypothetical protein